MASVWQFVWVLVLKSGTRTNIGIDSFTIKAVSQDDFDDVKVPDAPAQSPGAGASTMATPVAAK